MHNKNSKIRLFQRNEKLGLGVIYPSIFEIANEIAKREKSRLIPTGVYAMNRLGLSTQVPAKVIFLTNGALRTIKLIFLQ